MIFDVKKLIDEFIPADVEILPEDVTQNHLRLHR